jgi:hypothetical protein
VERININISIWLSFRITSHPCYTSGR